MAQQHEHIIHDRASAAGSLSPRSIIHDWLDGIDISTDSPFLGQRKRKRKRKVAPTHPLVTPPMSSSASQAELDDDSTTPEHHRGARKRPRHDSDPDRTPRGQARASLGQRKRRHGSAHSGVADGSDDDDRSSRISLAPSSTTKTTSSSAPGYDAISHTGSPLRQIASLRIQTESVTMRALTSGTEDMPPALNAMWREMEIINSGFGVLCPNSNGVNASSLKALDIPSFAVAESPEKRSALGPTPSADAVCDLLADAVRCQEAGFDEHGWNVDVHAPLIKLALDLPRRPGRKQTPGGLDMGVDLIPW